MVVFDTPSTGVTLWIGSMAPTFQAVQNDRVLTLLTEGVVNSTDVGRLHS